MKLLHIEDDEIEVMKLRQVLSVYPDLECREATDGLDALEYLQQARELPDLIIMDINMPRLGGLEFLKRIKESERLRHLPVVVLSSSKNPRDIKSCGYLGVAGYFVKPLRLEAYVELIGKLMAYWSQNLLIHSGKGVKA